MIEKIEYDVHIEWRLNGKLHREDGPAIEWANGSKQWWLNGELHREDGPACENADGSKQWWLNGFCHREDGPAVELASGTRKWFLNGVLHREDGPAIEFANGYKSWYMNDHWIFNIKLYLTNYYTNCIGKFLYNKNKDYLIFCFERENYYFYTVLWKEIDVDGKRYNCSLEELKRLL